MSEKSGPNWAFKVMSLIHDNPIRRKFSSPDQTLINAGLKPGQTVLEVGCGPGFFTISAANIVTDTGCVYALDIHPSAIKKIQKKIDKSNKENIIPLLKSAHETTLPNDSIDLAFLFGLPRLLRNDNLFLKVQTELYRILSNNGIMAIKSKRKDMVTKVKSDLFSFIEIKDGIFVFIKNIEPKKA